MNFVFNFSLNLFRMVFVWCDGALSCMKLKLFPGKIFSIASIISCSKHFRYVVPYTSKPLTPEKIGTRHAFSLYHSIKHHSYAEIVTLVMKSCRINIAFPTTNPDAVVQFIGFYLNDDILGTMLLSLYHSLFALRKKTSHLLLFLCLFDLKE